MKLQRISRLVVLLLAAMMIVAGCGGSAPAPAANAPAAAPAAKEAPKAAAPVAPAAPVDKYPDQTITLIDNYAAGGATDLLGRALLKAAEKDLGVSVIVKNVPGAEATLGPTELSKAKPDGNTIGHVTLSALSISPHTMKAPYVAEDFEYIIRYGRFQYGLGVAASSPIKTVDDLVQMAKRGERVTYSSLGLPGAIAMSLLGNKTGAKFTYVPYTSGPEAAAAIVSRTVTAGVSTYSSSMSFVKSGDMRKIGIISGSHWNYAPEVKTLEELGYGFEVSSDLGIVVPKGTPANRVEKLRQVFRKAMDDPDFQKVAMNMGMDAKPLVGDEFKKFVIAKRKEFGDILQQMGLKTQP